MTEDFLHYIWMFQLFHAKHLCTTDFQTVSISSPGRHNTLSGPDFSDAKIIIDGVTWVGQVEIHVCASHWVRHQHTSDPAYHNTILHVVWEEDQVILNAHGQRLPCLSLRGRVTKSLLHTYSSLREAKQAVACQSFVHTVDEFTWMHWKERLAAERLARKVGRIRRMARVRAGSLSQVFWVTLCQYWGMHANAQPMQLLANYVPLTHLLRIRDHWFTLEATLLGVAGFLTPPVSDAYTMKLRREFIHQQRKYHYLTVPKVMWKFGGVRPSNFPELRLAQLAALIHLGGDVYHQWVIQESPSLLLQQVMPSPYWNYHYRLGFRGRFKKKRIGKGLSNSLFINVVIPHRITYSQEIGSPVMRIRAFEKLNQLPPEQNGVVHNWKVHNIFAGSALESQALIELTNNYCKPKKCLTCGIGNKILRT